MSDVEEGQCLLCSTHSTALWLEGNRSWRAMLMCACMPLFSLLGVSDVSQQLHATVALKARQG